MSEEDFEPRLGRLRSGGSKAGKRYSHQVLAAVNRAGGRAVRKGGFTGKFGRGGAMGALLVNRDRFAAFRQRRVIVKARIVKLAGKGLDGAKAHMRYLQRDGVTREGERGLLYTTEKDCADGKAFVERAKDDRHQFRFIVAPEDGLDYDDLKPLIRRLMMQMEEDLDKSLDWVAVDHFNTGHPHAHILVRGKDDTGRDLVIAPTYISTGIRERAAELVSLDLGPRTDNEIETRLRGEVDAESLTSLDRHLLRLKSDDGMVKAFSKDPFRQTLLMGRLKHLERLGLAEEERSGWRLADGLEDTLRRMGERGDIIKTMHREMTSQNIAHSPADYAIYNPTDLNTKPVTGRVVARGLLDELNDRHYLIVDGADGCAHYIDIGRDAATEPTPRGSIVHVSPKSVEPRQVDRTVAEIAAANGGRYTRDLHMRHDPRATEAFVETHIRRLEAIRRVTGGVTREPDGTWTIAPDHLDRAAAYEQAQAKTASVIVDRLSKLTLDQQVGTDGATWLDRELVSGHPEQTRDSGFGHEFREATQRRRQWLIEQGLAQETPERMVYRSDMLAILQKRELTRIAGQLSDQLGLAYVETRPGDRVEGRLSRAIELASGKAVVIEKSKEFTLVPWRPVLDRHIGKQVSGIMRSDGGISWTIGKQKGMGVE
jgi:type IV secretory pathway VirD2 relaxase